MISGITALLGSLLNERGSQEPWFYKKNCRLSGLLVQKKYLRIIQNRDLFITLFCSIANKDANFVKVTEQVKFKKTSNGIPPELEHYIERIRQIFEGAFTGEKATIFFPLIKERAYIAQFTKDKATDKYSVDLCRIKVENKSKILAFQGNLFVSILKPIFAQMAESLGGICSSERIQNLQIKKIKGVTVCDVEVLKVLWERKALLEHHIEPKIIEQKRDVTEQLYLEYLVVANCDLILAVENEQIFVHKEVFANAAGPVFETMFKWAFLESAESLINFNTYSVNTIKVFVEFLYLGVEGVPMETFKDVGADICQLLELAHMYQITSLYDHCLNILDVYSDTSDADSINELANLYNDRHLKRLYETLSEPSFLRAHRM